MLQKIGKSFIQMLTNFIDHRKRLETKKIKLNEFPKKQKKDQIMIKKEKILKLLNMQKGRKANKSNK